jgi:hypothetical protein
MWGNIVAFLSDLETYHISICVCMEKAGRLHPVQLLIEYFIIFLSWS